MPNTTLLGRRTTVQLGGTIPHNAKRGRGKTPTVGDILCRQGQGLEWGCHWGVAVVCEHVALCGRGAGVGFVQCVVVLCRPRVSSRSRKHNTGGRELCYWRRQAAFKVLDALAKGREKG